MLEDLDSVAWQEQPQPRWNAPGEPAAALRALEAVESEAQAREAYDRLLYAVGNNHAGTYYPVVLAVLPFLRELLDHPRLLVRETVLDVLVDLAISFEPEPGFAAAGGQSLRTAVQDAIGQLRARVAACADAAGSPREAKLARDLLDGTAAHA